MSKFTFCISKLILLSHVNFCSIAWNYFFFQQLVLKKKLRLVSVLYYLFIIQTLVYLKDNNFKLHIKLLWYVFVNKVQ